MDEEIKTVEIEVKNLMVSYDNFVLLKSADFTINNGDIFVIMGKSGCGKSTLMSILTGLKKPSVGNIFIHGYDFLHSDKNVQDLIMKKCGVLYQSGALFTSMTLAENVAIPLQQYTNYSKQEIAELVSLKLSLVGLSGFENFYPSEISGGMKKRAGFARALALDPKILYFDEPSSGLDPISARLLDDLIVEINQSLGTTIVIISHDINSILNIGTNSIFLDADEQKIIGYGKPSDLLNTTHNNEIISFLTRGENK